MIFFIQTNSDQEAILLNYYSMYEYDNKCAHENKKRNSAEENGCL